MLHHTSSTILNKKWLSRQSIGCLFFYLFNRRNKKIDNLSHYYGLILSLQLYLMDYTDPSLFDRVPVRMTLKTAQNYMGKLKGAQASAPKSKAKARRASLYAYGADPYSSITSTSSATLDFLSQSTLEPTSDSFLEHIQKSVDAAHEERAKRFVVSYDIIVLKDALFAKNAERGVSQILSQIDFVNAQLADLKSLMQSSTSAIQPSDAEMLKLLYTRNNAASVTVPKPVTVAVYTQAELKEQIKQLTRKLKELEEKRDKLNSTSHITVPLSSFSRSELGLDDVAEDDDAEADK